MRTWEQFSLVRNYCLSSPFSKADTDAPSHPLPQDSLIKAYFTRLPRKRDDRGCITHSQISQTPDPIVIAVA